jgi:hypothetical protein
MKQILTLFALLAGLTMQAQIPSYVPTDGLVGYWPFNGNANDESGNGNDGVVNGATLTEDRDGNLNAAYIFDGNDFIDLNDDFDYPERTVNLWLRADDIDVTLGEVFASDHPGLLNGSTEVAVKEIDGIDQLLLAALPAVIWQNGTEGLWYHVSISRNITETSFFINGVFISTELSGVVSSQNGYSKALLGCTRNFDRFFTGVIDDIAIYNRALTEEEILALYNANDCSVSIETIAGDLTPFTLEDNTSVVSVGRRTRYQSLVHRL